MPDKPCDCFTGTYVLTSSSPPLGCGAIEPDRKERFKGSHFSALNFMEISKMPHFIEASWGFTILDIWDIVQNFAYPQAPCHHTNMSQHFRKNIQTKAKHFCHHHSTSKQHQQQHSIEVSKKVPIVFMIFGVFPMSLNRPTFEEKVPQSEVTILHQFLEWGPTSTPPGSEDSSGPPGFWVFELGSHRALSNEPIAASRGHGVHCWGFSVRIGWPMT